MRRWTKRIAVAMLLLGVILATPIVWIEGLCTAPHDPAVAATKPLVTDRGYARRESDSYLSFAEWHIVYAYEDLAGVLRRGDESEFAWGRQTVGFWRSLCALNRIVTARGGAPTDTKVMLYTIGWSFTAELAIKGAYEKGIGRLFEWSRGGGKTPEDTFVARDMQAYADFLRQTPWYEYPFRSRLVAFWRETPFQLKDLARRIERRVVFTVEYGVKAVYGALIGYGSAATLPASALEIQSVVVGLEPGDAKRDPRITIVRELGGGRTLIRTARYQAYTDLMVDLARRGKDVAEIAGNQRILVTVLAPRRPLPSLPGTTQLFEVAIQSKPDRRRIGLDVSVERLAATIRALERAGTSIEHIYDY